MVMASLRSRWKKPRWLIQRLHLMMSQTSSRRLLSIAWRTRKLPLYSPLKFTSSSWQLRDWMYLQSKTSLRLLKLMAILKTRMETRYSLKLSTANPSPLILIATAFHRPLLSSCLMTISKWSLKMMRQERKVGMHNFQTKKSIIH